MRIYVLETFRMIRFNVSRSLSSDVRAQIIYDDSCVDCASYGHLGLFCMCCELLHSTTNTYIDCVSLELLVL